MTVVEIIPHGLCNGVNSAVARALELRDAYFLHAPVHNEIILADLRARGHRFVETIEEIPPGATVVFPAHGTSPQVRGRAAERGLQVVDLTCPSVARAHAALRAAAARGDAVVVLGDRDHVEVQGLLDEAAACPSRGESGETTVVCQTSMDGRTVEAEVERLRGSGRRIREVCGPCGATGARQQAVRDFCAGHPKCAVLVLGSATSANSRRLRDVAEAAGGQAFFASTADEVRALKATLRLSETVGVTSGASTPERLYREAMGILDHDNG